MANLKHVTGILIALMVVLGTIPLWTVEVHAQENPGNARDERVAQALIHALERYIRMVEERIEKLRENGTEIPENITSRLEAARESLNQAKIAFDQGDYASAKQYALEGLSHLREILRHLPLRLRIRFTLKETLRFEIKRTEMIINRTLQVVERIQNETVKARLEEALRNATALLEEARSLLGEGKVREAAAKVKEAKQVVYKVLNAIDELARRRALVKAREIGKRIALGIDNAIERIDAVIERLRQLESNNVNVSKAIEELEAVKEKLTRLKEELGKIHDLKKVHQIVQKLKHALKLNKAYKWMCMRRAARLELRDRLARQHNITGYYWAYLVQAEAVKRHLDGMIKAIKRIPWVDEEIKNNLTTAASMLHNASEKVKDAVKAYYEGDKEEALSLLKAAQEMISEVKGLIEATSTELGKSRAVPHGMIRMLRAAAERLEHIMSVLTSRLETALEQASEATPSEDVLEALENALELSEEVKDRLEELGLSNETVNSLIQSIREAKSSYAAGDVNATVQQINNAIGYAETLSSELQAEGVDNEISSLITGIVDLLNSALEAIGE